MNDRIRTLASVVLLAAVAAASFFVYFAEYFVHFSIRENEPRVYDFSTLGEYRDAAGLPVGLAYAAVAVLLVGGALMLRRRTAYWSAAAAFAVIISLALPVAVPAALPGLVYGEDPVFRFETSYPDPARGRQIACFVHAVEGTEDKGSSAPELCVQVPYRGKRPRLLTDQPAELDSDVSFGLARDLNESGLRPFDSLEGFESGRVEVIRADWVNPPGEVALRPQPRPLTPPPTPRGDAGTKGALFRVATLLRPCAGRPGGYPPCAEIDALRRAGISTGGGGLGGVELTVTPQGYSVVSVSTTGTTFTITAFGRRLHRFCTPARQGACRADGTW